MTYSEYRERRGRAGSGCLSLAGSVLLMAFGGVLLVGLILLCGIWRAGDSFLGGISDLFTGTPPTPQVDTRSVVLQQVRGVSELTTTVQTHSAITEVSQDRVLGDFVIGTTRLLYVAVGEVRAGVNLAQLEATDVEVISDTIRLRLPPPIILDSKIDVNRSDVYDVDQGFLNLGPDSLELQTLAERGALQQVVAAACQAGILEQANREAEIAVAELLSVAGYQQILVETQPPAPGTCPGP